MPGKEIRPLLMAGDAEAADLASGPGRGHREDRSFQARGQAPHSWQHRLPSCQHYGARSAGSASAVGCSRLRTLCGSKPWPRVPLRAGQLVWPPVPGLRPARRRPSLACGCSATHRALGGGLKSQFRVSFSRSQMLGGCLVSGCGEQSVRWSSPSPACAALTTGTCTTWLGTCREACSPCAWTPLESCLWTSPRKKDCNKGFQVLEELRGNFRNPGIPRFCVRNKCCMSQVSFTALTSLDALRVLLGEPRRAFQKGFWFILFKKYMVCDPLLC